MIKEDLTWWHVLLIVLVVILIALMLRAFI